jgi:branched-chain amino acid transport system permease protein
LSLLLLGLVTGSFFALFACSLTLVYRVSGVLNFALGATAMMATFTFAFSSLRMPPFVAVLAGLAVGAGIGLVMGFAMLLFEGRRLEATALTIAALGLLQAAGQLIFGGHPLAFSHLFPPGVVRVGGGLIVLDEVSAAAVGLIVCACVVAGMRVTGTGLRARAMALGQSVVPTLGYATAPWLLASWAFAGLLSAAGGILLLTVQAAPDAASFTLLAIESFAAALVGRLVTLPAAVLGGLIVGVLEVGGDSLLGQAGAGRAAVLLLTILLLGAFPPQRVRLAAGRSAL